MSFIYMYIFHKDNIYDYVLPGTILHPVGYSSKQNREVVFYYINCIYCIIF